jgi:hypothetical protein
MRNQAKINRDTFFKRCLEYFKSGKRIPYYYITTAGECCVIGSFMTKKELKNIVKKNNSMLLTIKLTIFYLKRSNLEDSNKLFANFTFWPQKMIKKSNFPN